ncbi:MAG: M23 family metallopeptidase, partial [Cyanobium sp.]
MAALGLTLGVAVGPGSLVVQSSSGSVWRLGVFPVASFAGYTSHYGERLGPSGGLEPHHGIDIAAPFGSPIRNWWGGVVKEVINDGRCG